MAPKDHELVDFDLKTCHPAILAALSGDSFLTREVLSDLHATVGAWLMPGADPAQQRGIGKAFNALAVADAPAHTVARQFSVSLDVAESALSTWWASFPTARAFQSDVRRRFDELRRADRSLVFAGGGRTLARFDRWFLRGQPTSGRPARAGDLDHAYRSVLTALYRAVESLLLDAMLVHAGEVGARLVLPIYDGALLAIPGHGSERISQQALQAMRRVLSDSRVPTSLTFERRATWA